MRATGEEQGTAREQRLLEGPLGGGWWFRTCPKEGWVDFLHEDDSTEGVPEPTGAPRQSMQVAGTAILEVHPRHDDDPRRVLVVSHLMQTVVARDERDAWYLEWQRLRPRPPAR
jgi:hypothetical protein